MGGVDIRSIVTSAHSVRPWPYDDPRDLVTTVPSVSHPARPLSQWDDLWRPSLWRSAPDAPQRTGVHLVVIVALALYANVIVNEVLGPPWYVPFNLGVLGIALLLARGGGATSTAMGFRVVRARRGFAVGGMIAVVIVAFVVVAVIIPSAKDAFEDQRIVEGSIWLSLYHALFRVPLGTALYEEVLFRGIIFGMLARRTSALSAAVWSSVLFGIWHILPAIDAIETHPIGDVLGGSWEAVVAAVVSTFIAGLVFVWIRLYAGSIVAPILVHVASNSTAILASTYVVHVL
jgi:membrane protease YdiL (CAAX protease family)